MRPSREEPETVKLWRREQLALACACADEYFRRCALHQTEKAEAARARYLEAISNIEKCERALRMKGVSFVAITRPALRGAPVREIVRVKPNEIEKDQA